MSSGSRADIPPLVAVLGTRYPDFSIETAILAPEGVEVVDAPGDTPDQIVEVAGSARVIIAGSRPRFTTEVLERLHCRAIVRAGIGLDSVDLGAARRLGYVVAYVPDASTEAVAQHTLAMVLAAIRRLVPADRIVREGGWGFDALRPIHLPEALVAGVVGFGRIGRRVAELLHAVGFGEILVHDALVTPDGPGIVASPLEDLLARADVVTLHAPAPQGGHLIGPEEVATMKPGAVLVNTARGGLVDTDALAAGLASGRPGFAALDVFTPEPPDLAAFGDVLDRMVLTPHTAWYSEESQVDLRRKSAEEARRIIAGLPPRNPVVTPEVSA